MTFRLAHDPITISHDGNVVRLFPSMLAGMLMSQKYRIGTIVAAINDGNVTILSDIVTYGAPDYAASQTIVFDKLFDGGPKALHDLTQPILEFVAASMGITPADEEPNEIEERVTNDGNVFDFTTPLTELFEFATGWLCWTPAEAWAATPTEIIVARRGHYAMLKAIHGGDDTPAAHDPEALPSENDVKHGVSQIRSKLSAIA